MKQIFFILALSFLFIEAANAQVSYEVKNAFELYNSSKRQESSWTNEVHGTTIEGTPFLDEDFTEGSVYTTSKTQFVDVPLRYNIHKDRIEFRSDDDQVLALSVPEVVEKIEMGEYLLEYLPFYNAKNIRRGFFIVLEKGKASLYSRPQISFKEAKKPAGYQDAQPARFVRLPDQYYIRIGMEPATPVSKRKDLEEIFSNDDPEVLSFIKKNKIKPGKAESLKELVTFYNSQ